MKYERSETRNSDGEVLLVEEVWSFDSKEEEREWWARASAITPEEQARLDTYFPVSQT